MTKYELMVILPGDLTEKEALTHLEIVKGYVTSNGGSIGDELIWGKKDLAYRMKKHEVGFYAIYHFTMKDVKGMEEMKNELKIDQVVLRELIIKVDEDYTFANFLKEEDESQKILAEIMEKRKKKPGGRPGGPKKEEAQTEDKKEKVAEKKEPVAAAAKKKSSSDAVLDDPDLKL